MRSGMELFRFHFRTCTQVADPLLLLSLPSLVLPIDGPPEEEDDQQDVVASIVGSHFRAQTPPLLGDPQDVIMQTP